MNFMKFFSDGIQARVCIGIAAIGIGSAVMSAAGISEGTEQVLVQENDRLSVVPHTVELESVNDKATVSGISPHQVSDFTKRCVTNLSNLDSDDERNSLIPLCGQDAWLVQAGHVDATHHDHIEAEHLDLKLNF